MLLRPLVRKAGLQLSLHCSDNDVDDPFVEGLLGSALFVFDAALPSPVGLRPTICVSSNRLRTRTGQAWAALIATTGRCTATGNLIVNDGVRSKSLKLAVPKENVAVVGNVLVGQAVLPDRPTAGLPRWDDLNSET